MKIFCAQLNPTVGDLEGNKKLVLRAYHEAVENNAELIMLSELFLCGYPTEDLLLRPHFLKEVEETVAEIMPHITDTALLLPTAWVEGDKTYNAALLIQNGSIKKVLKKSSLPDYDVFDESRLFSAVDEAQTFTLGGICFGVGICRDIWQPEVCEKLKQAGAEVILSPNASPYAQEKLILREQVAVTCTTITGVPLIYVNQWGGQDELVFDGCSFVMNDDGKQQLLQPAFKNSCFAVNLSKTAAGYTCKADTENSNLDAQEMLYSALKTGVKDYFRKTGFGEAIIGLSGGVDSAIVAAIAVAALGKNNVQAVFLPSVYTSVESLDDARTLADNLGISLLEIPIHKTLETVEKTLDNSGITATGLAAENLQARSRGLLLMALSNQTNALLLTTGNKSEMAVGYATLYGDMCGAFNPIKDLYKTEVYNLCRYINSVKHTIPENIINKEPTAELRHNQKDSDSLPPYTILDEILRLAIEEKLSTTEIITRGFKEGIVTHILSLLRNSEYKRRQAAPGIKVSDCHFGKGWRYPIAGRTL